MSGSLFAEKIRQKTCSSQVPNVASARKNFPSFLVLFPQFVTSNWCSASFADDDKKWVVIFSFHTEIMKYEKECWKRGKGATTFVRFPVFQPQNCSPHTAISRHIYVCINITNLGNIALYQAKKFHLQNKNPWSITRGFLWNSSLQVTSNKSVLFVPEILHNWLTEIRLLESDFI